MPHPAPESHHLRARGNLSYLQFIRLVEYLWGRGYPDIPIIPSASDRPAQYPSIVYSLQLRKTHPSDPKPHYRETISKDIDTSIVVVGQRFQNVVAFTVITERDPHLAEAIIEEFEDFMMKNTPVFKELGASEFTYARRTPDDETPRPGEGMVERTVTYLLTTEKIVNTEYDKLREAVIDARIFFAGETTYFVTAVPEDATPATADTIYVRGGVEFKIGDLVSITRRPGFALPTGLVTGMYYISNIISDEDNNRQYQLARSQDGVYVPLENLGPGHGYIGFAPESEAVTVKLESHE